MTTVRPSTATILLYFASLTELYTVPARTVRLKLFQVLIVAFKFLVTCATSAKRLDIEFLLRYRVLAHGTTGDSPFQ